MILGFQAQSQRILLNADTFSYERTRAIVLSESLAATGSMIGLHQLWYKDYERGKLHSFDDSSEWLQMDKAGHMYSAYTLGYTNYKIFRWAGISESKSIWLGGSVGLAFLSLVELQDGFSKAWGFSWSDMGANVLGYLFFSGQQQIWKEQRIQLKFSYNSSPYRTYRPEVLGNGGLSSLFKDYNAQRYWASVNVHSFLPEASKFPKWLNIAAGYSADGMLGGTSNPLFIGESGMLVPQFERRRQFYLAPDIDLTKLKVKKTWLKQVLFVLNVVKLPAPSLELSSGPSGLQFRALPLFF